MLEGGSTMLFMTQVHALDCFSLDFILLMGCLLVDVQVLASFVAAKLGKSSIVPIVFLLI